MRRIAPLVAAAVLAPVALAASSATPGVTATTITIGGTVPITGPAALFGSVGRGADAYFKYVNAKGGVNGRKIRYLYLDDAYDPAKTVQETRRLVEQENVLAIFNSAGTDNALAVRDYLNAAKVPQLFVGSGASALADPKGHPWTVPYLPSHRGEGVIYGRYIAQHLPNAKIAVLEENSPYGKDLSDGLRKGLGSKASRIVTTQSYEPTDSTIESQLSALKASGANTLVLAATPQYAILSYVALHKFAWRPQVFVASINISPNVMDIIRASAPVEVNGAYSIAFVKDPTDRVWAKDPVVSLYRTILKRYAPGTKPVDVYNFYGMAVAYTMVDALKRAGKNLSRESLLRAATHLNETNPFMRPGIKIRTTPSDYYPIAKAQLLRYRTNHWVASGGLVAARG